MTLGFINFLECSKPSLSLVLSNADNSTYYGTALDMTGYEGVVFLATAKKGEIMTYGLKAQQDTDSGFGTAQDLVNSNVAFSTAVATDGFAFLEIQHPREQYVRPALVVPNVVTPNTVSVIAIRYGKNVIPETNTDGERHDGVAEGTA